MRVIVIGLAALMAATAADVTPGAAQGKSQRQRPTWCFTPDPPGSPSECLYYSFEQCRATASGIGGSCDPNYPPSAWGRQYQPPLTQPQTKRQQRQQQDRDWRW
jgi:hypothetical protein